MGVISIGFGKFLLENVSILGKVGEGARGTEEATLISVLNHLCGNRDVALSVRR